MWPSYLRIGSVGQLCTTLCTAASQNLATVCGCHTLPEAMLHLTVPLLRLICSLHGNRHSFSFVSSCASKQKRSSESSGLQIFGAVTLFASQSYDKRAKIPLQGLIIQEKQRKVKCLRGDLCTLPKNQVSFMPEIYNYPRIPAQGHMPEQNGASGALNLRRKRRSFWR